MGVLRKELVFFPGWVQGCDEMGFRWSGPLTMLATLKEGSLRGDLMATPQCLSLIHAADPISLEICVQTKQVS